MTDSTKKENSADAPTLTLDAKVRASKEVRPWNAILWKAAGEAVAFMPSHRNTREGRKKKKQMQAGLVILGILLMAVGGTADQWGAFWILLGIFLASLAFVAPVEELKKRGWRTKVKKKQKPRQQPVWKAGSVIYDGRRVELREDGEKVRRVRVDRGKHEVTTRRSGQDRPCLGILPPGGKDSEGIWVVATNSVDVDVDWEGDVADDEMDHPAKVDAGDWNRLWEALRELEPA